MKRIAIKRESNSKSSLLSTISCNQTLDSWEKTSKFFRTSSLWKAAPESRVPTRNLAQIRTFSFNLLNKTVLSEVLLRKSYNKTLNKNPLLKEKASANTPTFQNRPADQLSGQPTAQWPVVTARSIIGWILLTDRSTNKLPDIISYQVSPGMRAHCSIPVTPIRCPHSAARTSDWEANPSLMRFTNPQQSYWSAEDRQIFLQSFEKSVFVEKDSKSIKF